MKRRKTPPPELDIHGLREEEAQRKIAAFLDGLDDGVCEVVIIHGYRGGQVLRDMVRTQLRHPRIVSVLPALNEGTTRIILSV